MSKKIILLAGPTASGKSKLAIQLAKKLNGEIINADSMQIYKEFKILSSRPDNKETRKAKHHLYGVISVKKHFSAGNWLKLANSKINLCFKLKKVPIIVAINKIDSNGADTNKVKNELLKHDILVESLGGDIPAIEVSALKRTNLTIKDNDIEELNEAFASQSLACIKDLGIDEKKVNLDGGALALGHPLGATGARITGKVAQLLKRENKKYALASQCIGLGMGIATIIESVD